MKLLDKVKQFFKEKYRRIALIVAIGVGTLLVAFSFIGTGDDGEGDANAQTLAEYKAELECELEAVCSSIKGVGRCEVIVTFSRGAENTYKGATLIESKPPEVMGVSVICEGADSDEVRADIVGMMASLFGIGKNRISVMKLG